MGSLAEVILQKTVQTKPLRSTLNRKFGDLKELEFEIRKRVLSPDNLSTNNLVNDHYARIQGVTGAYSSLTTPLKHTRRQSERKFKTQRSKLTSHRLTDTDGLSSRPTTARLLDSHELTSYRPSAAHSTKASYLPASKTFPSFIETSRPTSSGLRTERPTSSHVPAQRLTTDIEERCLATRKEVKREKRLVRKQRKKCSNNFKACTKKIEAALRADIIGFVPKALLEYQARKEKPKPSTAKIPTTAKAPAYSLEREIVREYRKGLASRAFARGMDRDLRYIYTLGSLTSFK